MVDALRSIEHDPELPFVGKFDFWQGDVKVLAALLCFRNHDCTFF